MKFCAVLVALLAFLAVASSRRYPYPQVRPPVRYPPVRYPQVRYPQVIYPQVPSQSDRFSASLGGAKVGNYGRIKTLTGPRNGFNFEETEEVYAESLGGAQVGLFGNDRN